MKTIHWTNCNHPFKYINVVKVEKGNPTTGQHPIKIIHLQCIQCKRRFERSPILK